MSCSNIVIARNGRGPHGETGAVISRRNFLSLLAPLPFLPVFGPYMLLSEKPIRFGWTGALTPLTVEQRGNSHGTGFDWRTVAERLLSERHFEREILRRQRHSSGP